MTRARADILRRLDEAAPAHAARPRASLPPAQRRPERPLAEALAAALDELGVTWEVADSPVSARLHLATALQSEAVRRVLTWKGEELPVPGIQETLNVLGIETTIPALRAVGRRLRPQDPDLRRDLLRAIAGVELGIVAAEAAWADTGSLVLRGGKGRPLLAALLPRRLIVLLPESRIVPSYQEWQVSLPGDDAEGASAPPVTLLTGPSQSFDLELNSALGIHGPRRIHVVLVNGI